MIDEEIRSISRCVAAARSALPEDFPERDHSQHRFGILAECIENRILRSGHKYSDFVCRGTVKKDFVCRGTIKKDKTYFSLFLAFCGPDMHSFFKKFNSKKMTDAAENSPCFPCCSRWYPWCPYYRKSINARAKIFFSNTFMDAVIKWLRQFLTKVFPPCKNVFKIAADLGHSWIQNWMESHHTRI